MHHETCNACTGLQIDCLHINFCCVPTLVGNLKWMASHLVGLGRQQWQLERSVVLLSSDRLWRRHRIMPPGSTLASNCIVIDLDRASWQSNPPTPTPLLLSCCSFRFCHSPFCHFSFCRLLPQVDIEPQGKRILPKKRNRAIMKEVIRTYRDKHLGGRQPAYDDMHTLYTSVKLPSEKIEIEGVTPPEEDEVEGSPDVPRRWVDFDILTAECVSDNLLVAGAHFTDRRLGIKSVDAAQQTCRHTKNRNVS